MKTGLDFLKENGIICQRETGIEVINNPNIYGLLNAMNAYAVSYAKNVYALQEANKEYVMTLQEAKDQIAKKYDHKDWYEFRCDGRDWRIYEDAHDEAAELYADRYRRLAKDCAYKYQQLHTHHYGFEDKETPKDASIPEGKSIFDRWKDCED